jgi:restriction endonuclease S subunit
MLRFCYLIQVDTEPTYLAWLLKSSFARLEESKKKYLSTPFGRWMEEFMCNIPSYYPYFLIRLSFGDWVSDMTLGLGHVQAAAW